MKKDIYICISWYDPVADGNRMQFLIWNQKVLLLIPITGKVTLISVHLM